MSAPWEDFGTAATVEDEPGPWSDFSGEDGPWNEFASAEIEPQPVTIPGFAGNELRRIPDLQTTTRGGSPLSLPSGAAKSVLGELGGEFGQFVENIHTPTFNLAEPLTDPELEQFKAEGKGTQRMAGVYDSLASTANFFTSPMGVATLGIGALPRAAQKVIAGIFAAQMASSVPEIATELGTELGKPESERDQVKLANLITTGATTAGLATLTGTHALRLTPKALKLADVLDEADIVRDSPRSDPRAVRELGVRLNAEPFLQPGIPALADAALREAGQVIIDPRADAIGELRRAIEPPQIEPVTIATAERIQGGGEAPYGKTSFMREAEAPTAERTQAARQETPPSPEAKAGTPLVDKPTIQLVEELTPPAGPPTPEVTPEISEFATAFEAGKPTTTNSAQAAGLKAKSVADLEALVSSQKRYLENIDRIIAESEKQTDPVKAAELFDEAVFKMGSNQFPREALEAATNIGSTVESQRLQLGQRPLDWKTHPEVAEWLKKNAATLEKMSVRLPAELKASPTVEITPAEFLRRKESGLPIPAAELDRNSMSPPAGWVREGDNYVPPKPPTPESAQKPVLQPRSGGFDVAYSDPKSGERVGFLQIDTDPTRGVAVIKAVDVNEGSTRRGIATQLYENARSELLKRGITTVKGSLEGSGPVQLREKVFGAGNTKYFRGTEELTAAEAIEVMDKDFGYVRAETTLKESKPTTPKVTTDFREQIRKKQDEIIATAKRKGLDEDTPISDVQVGAPTIRELKESIFPDFEDSMNSFLESNPSEKPTPKGVTNEKEIKRPQEGILATPVAGELGAISKLESLKFKADKNGNVIPNDPGQVFSLPHPDAVKQIGKQLWNDAIDVALTALKAGKTVAEAVEVAFAKIRYNAKGIDQAKVRANLRAAIATPEQKPTGTALTDKVEMRTLSERATTSEKIPEPVQEKIQSAPESYYQVQSLKGVDAAAKAKTDLELAGTTKDSDSYTADKLELSTRLLNTGKHEQGYRVFQELSADLTRMGQVINQAKLFQALRPEHVVTVLNKDLVKAGRDPLTLEQSSRVEAAAEARIKKQGELDKATDEWMKNPTDENAAKAETAQDAANQAAVTEQSLVNQFRPRSTASVLKSVLQGNLLTPISQVANLVGNVSFIPFRAGSRATATAIDMLDAAIRNRPRQVSVAPVGGTKAAVEGLIREAKKIPSILIRGTGETIKGEPRAGLHPLRAWVKQVAKNPDVPTVGGKIPFSERLNLAIEGTFGVPAEIMLRGLGSGDAPFRGAARGRLIAEASRLQKLKPSDSKMAQRFPELFFDKATLERIDGEGRAAIFQRHSSTIDRLMELSRSRGDLMDFAIATVAPYKLTPWNIVGEILSYNPLIATARAGIEARRGNTRAAEINAGKALVGGMTIYAGYWLYENGLLSPSLDSRDEQQKARMLAGEVMPPNHVNVSGLKRKLAGGDAAFKAGDETVDIFRGGGLAGALFYMVANIGRDMETSAGGDDILLSVLKNSTLEQARFGVNQSFLKGVTGLLDAVRYGETDSYIQSYAGTVLSIPLPNTLSAISRAQRQYKVDASDPKFKKQMENLVRTRLGFAGLDDYLPLKRGLWGEPLLETPANASALVYHFFDISKNKQVTSDPVSLELYRLWRKTASTSVIPTPPEKTITVNRQTHPLTSAQYSRYVELVGENRRDIIGKVVTNPAWHTTPEEEKMKLLEKIYRVGLERGKEAFMAETKEPLATKPAKAGFK